MSKRRKQLDIDTICSEAIAKSAVEARLWAAGNSDNVMAETYLERAETFYSAGATGCWFDEFEENEDEGVTLVGSMIVQLPETAADREKVVSLFLAELGNEDTVDEPEEYVGSRYAQFTFYS